MRKFEIDARAVAGALGRIDGLGGEWKIARIHAGNSSANFRATQGGRKVLAKVVPVTGSSEARCAKIEQFSRRFGQLVAVQELDGSRLFVLKWIDGEAIPPEDWTEREVASFVRSRREWFGEGLIHGDLNWQNVLFKDGAVAGVVDFEMAREGREEEDLLRAFAHRAERLPFWAAGARRRVLKTFGRVVQASGIERERWIAAIEGYRLRKEGIRLKKARFGWLARADLAIRARLFRKLRIVADAAFAFPQEPGRTVISAKDVDAAAVADALGMARLAPLDVGCASAVFKGAASDGSEWFVKVVGLGRIDELERAAAFWPGTARPSTLDGLGLAALAMPWREGRHVKAEDLTDGEARNLIRAHADLLRRLEELPQETLALAKPALDYEAMADIAAMSFFSRRVPEQAEPRSLCVSANSASLREKKGALVPVHGDLQHRNVAFRKGSEEVAAFFDLDSVRWGDAAVDLVYAITDRYRKSIPEKARRRLEAILEIFIAQSPWPRERWVRAIELQRLAVESKLLAAHPLSVFARISAWRHGKALRRLARSASRDRQLLAANC